MTTASLRKSGTMKQQSSAVLLPSSSIASHIFPYLNRDSYIHATLVNKEMFEASRQGRDAPWPQCSIQTSAAEVRSIAFSPTNTALACGCGDGTIRLWKSKDGHCSVLQGHESDVLALAFAPDGSFLVSGSRDCTVRLWSITHNNAGEEKIVCTSVFKGHTYPVHSISVSPDATIIASNGYEKNVRLWSAVESRCIGTIQHNEELESAVIAPDGRTIATSTWDGCVRLWDILSDATTTTQTTRIAATHTILGQGLPSTALRFSTDGRFLYGLRGFRIRKWSMNDAGEKKSCVLLKGHRNSRVVSVALSDNTGTAAFGECDGTIRLTTLVTEGTRSMPASLEIARIGSSNENSLLAFSPDNRILASAAPTAGKIQLWNT